MAEKLDAARQDLTSVRRSLTSFITDVREITHNSGLALTTVEGYLSVLEDKAKLEVQRVEYYLELLEEELGKEGGAESEKYQEASQKETAASSEYEQKSEKAVKHLREVIAVLKLREEPLKPTISPLFNPYKPAKPEDEDEEEERPLKNREENVFRIKEIKYPRLQLPTFAGESAVKYWNFINQFQLMVESNTNLQDIEKYSLLKGCLQKEAAELLDGFPFMASSYRVALNRLKEEYGDATRLHLELSRRIRELKSIEDPDDIKGLRTLIVNAEAISISQEQLGQILGDNHTLGLLFDEVLSRLPADIGLLFSRTGGLIKRDWSALMTFLRSEIRLREQAALRRTRLSKPIKPEDKNTGQRSTVLPVTERQEASSSIQPWCRGCKGDHWIQNCPQWRELTAEKCRDKAREERRCFICLSTGHVAQNCTKKDKLKCSKCMGNHNSLLCTIKMKTSSVGVDVADVTDPTSAAVWRQDSAKVALQVMKGHIIGKDGALEPVNFFIDPGSQVSLISRPLAEKLGLEAVEDTTVNLCGIGKHLTSQRSKIFKCHIDKIGVVYLPALTNICDIPELALTQAYRTYLSGLGYSLSDPSILTRERPSTLQVDILIGVDLWDRFILNESVQLRDGLKLINSNMGWILWGCSNRAFMDYPSKQGAHSSHGTVSISNLCIDAKRDIERYSCACDEQEGLFQKKLSITDEETIACFESTVRQEKDGRYQVRLPVREEPVVLDRNYPQAKQRLGKTYEKLVRVGKLEEYQGIITEQLENGIIEEVGEPKGGGYYLPHRPVFRQTSTTTKVRIVYDASAEGVGGWSINSKLTAGPNLYPDLLGILLRLRRHPFVLSGDIEKAFHQVGIDSRDRKMLEFLWYDGLGSTKSFRFTRLPFGLISSPFLLGAVIQHHLQKYVDSEGPVVRKILQSLYVDDLLASVETEEECKELYKKTLLFLGQASLPMRKWFTNSRETSKLMQEESKDRVQEGFTRKELVGKNPDTLQEEEVSVLGVRWDSESDTLYFDGEEIYAEAQALEKPTKRQVASIALRLFDPLGLIAPCQTGIKCLIQQLWAGKLNWDDPITLEQRESFRAWFVNLPKLSQLHWPRWSQARNEQNLQIHIFSDASQKAYAAVVYVVVESQGKKVSHLLCSKMKVAPLRSERSMPQLELMGACLGIRLFEYICHQEFVSREVKRTYWTDAQAVLAWLKNPEIKVDVFCRNRIRFARKYSSGEDWKYCPSEQNPADLPSRGSSLLSKRDFELWTEGPEFLRSNSKTVVSTTFAMPVFEVDQPAELSGFEFSEKYSMYSTLVRSTKLALWVIQTWTKRTWGDRKSFRCSRLEPTLESASRLLLIRVQEIYLSEDLQRIKSGKSLIKGSKLRGLDPFLDDEGVLRLSGRLENSSLPLSEKHQIIIPANNQVIRLLIRQEHIRMGHPGVSMLLGHFRTKFWLFRGRLEIRKVIAGCPRCNRYNGRPFRQATAPLPAFRVEEARPFCNTGIDFFGPLITTTCKKVYGCLFTCAACRAVHIEVVKDLKTTTFWRVLRRFFARRGVPARIYTDNATTFLRCEEDCRILAESLKGHFPMTGELNLIWEHSVPRAPWWGGFYERLVGMTKNLLKKRLHTALVTLDELQTVLTEVEGVLNDRPLCYFPEQDGSYVPISPARLMTGHSINALPDWSRLSRMSEVSSSFPSKRLKLLEVQLGTLWQAWHKQYLLLLQSKGGDSGSSVEPCIDQVVLIMENNVPRGRWNMGRITELYKGRDGKVRSVCLKTAAGELRRAVQSLVPLEWPQNENSELETSLRDSADRL